MHSKASLVLALAIALQGCSPAAFRLPWTQAPGEESLVDLQEQLGGSADPKSVKPPRLLEPEPSGLPSLKPRDLEQCRATLALAPERPVPADPTNFGDRFTQDAWGRAIASSPMLIVIHETVMGAKETLAFFQTPHPRDEDQASYHMLIDRDGSRVRVTPDANRAYGAGMSAFGDVTQRVRPGSVGSINNIALHVSLVSPTDGREDTDGHSGYTDEQYAALAKQILLWQAEHGIPLTRVTTHSAIDRSQSRYDPRSFRWDRFNGHYQSATKQCKLGWLNNKEAGL
jgi:N-acetyl-anhydromuramyl-L-alanine amidase AmpD